MARGCATPSAASLCRRTRPLPSVTRSGRRCGRPARWAVGPAPLALGAVMVTLFLPARARDDDEFAVAGVGDGERPDTADAATPSGSGDAIRWESTDFVTGTRDAG